MNRAVAAIFLAFVCSGCPKRIDFGPTGQVTDAGELLQLVGAAQAQAVTVVGDGKLRVESPREKGSVSVYVAASRPGLLRMELFDFFNRPIAVLVTDGARFGLLQFQENTFYQGPATPRNLSRFLPVALPSEELVSIMLGQVPFIPASRMALRFDREEGLYVLTLQAGEATQRLHIHPTFLRVVRSDVEGVSAYDLEYDRFREREGLVFPEEVTLRSDAAQVLLRLRYTEISLNEGPDPTLFELIPPEGIPVVEVGEGGQSLPPLHLPEAPPDS